PGDLGDLDPAAVDDEAARPWIAWQVDHLPPLDLPELDALRQPRQDLWTEVGEQGDLPQIPEGTLGILHVSSVPALAKTGNGVGRLTEASPWLRAPPGFPRGGRARPG